MSPRVRRIVQAVLYEVFAILFVGPVLGLVFLLVPVMAWWLNTTLLRAFIADLGILAFFFVYAVAFTWCFDLVFGPPESARES